MCDKTMNSEMEIEEPLGIQEISFDISEFVNDKTRKDPLS